MVTTVNYEAISEFIDTISKSVVDSIVDSVSSSRSVAEAVAEAERLANASSMRAIAKKVADMATAEAARVAEVTLLHTGDSNKVVKSMSKTALDNINKLINKSVIDNTEKFKEGLIKDLIKYRGDADKQMRAIKTRVNRLFNGSLSSSSKVAVAETLKDTMGGGVVYKYVGPFDSKIRDFCAIHINEYGNEDHWKQVINQFGNPVWEDMGGYNCRHVLTPSVDPDSRKKFTNINRDDRTAILDYKATGTGINEYVSKGKLDNGRYSNRILRGTKGINRITNKYKPDFKGNMYRVESHGSVEDAISRAKSMADGNTTVSIKSFTSSKKSLERLMNKNQSNAKLVIRHTGAGYSIDDKVSSAFSNENEVIMPAGTRMVVEDIEVDGGVVTVTTKQGGAE